MKIKQVHAIILARGGSKGIKNKNLILVNKKPLIYWSIKSCLESKKISCTWVSSDNKKILNIAKKFGAKIIIRPKYLASDKASSDDAWLHAVNYIEKSYKTDIIVGVQPTSPIRSKFDFDKAIRKYKFEKLDSLFSANITNDTNFWEFKNSKFSANYNFKKRKMRQDLNKKYLENGSFYIFDMKKFKKEKCRLFGKIGVYLMNKLKSFQIDDFDDLKLINSIFKL